MDFFWLILADCVKKQNITKKRKPNKSLILVTKCYLTISIDNHTQPVTHKTIAESKISPSIIKVCSTKLKINKKCVDFLATW